VRVFSIAHSKIYASGDKFKRASNQKMLKVLLSR